MNKTVKILGLSMLLFAFAMTNRVKSDSRPLDAQSMGISALPSVIIYKTKKNYAKNVPIGLSEDKKTILSYPHPTNINVSSMPTKLKKKFWLDNRGIGVNVAFLSITYEEYSQLSSPPSISEMMKMIIDNDPIVEMYALPAGTDKSVPNLNKIISQKFEGAKNLKHN